MKKKLMCIKYFLEGKKWSQLQECMTKKKT